MNIYKLSEAKAEGGNVHLATEPDRKEKRHGRKQKGEAAQRLHVANSVKTQRIRTVHNHTILLFLFLDQLFKCDRARRIAVLLGLGFFRGYCVLEEHVLLMLCRHSFDQISGQYALLCFSIIMHPFFLI